LPTGYFLSSTDKPWKQVLEMREVQNEKLITDYWRVLNRWENKTCLDLTFEVYQTSFNELVRPNLHIDFGFAQRVKLTQRRRDTGKQSDQQDPPQQQVILSTSTVVPQPSTANPSTRKLVHQKVQESRRSDKKGPKGPPPSSSK
jgi:Domain of unknown function (DUF4780)